MSEDRSGFLPAMVRVYKKKEMSKPVFGKPSIKYGQVFVLAGYMFQLGGILGAAFHNNYTPFVTAYNGTTELEDALEGMEGKWIERVISIWDEVDSLNEFVMLYEDRRMNLPPDSPGTVATFGTKRVPDDTAFFLPWNFGMMGAALGLMKPEIYRMWFENNYKADPASWERAHKAGLAIPAQPDVVTYEEFELDALNMFVPYVGEFFPEFKDVLVA